MNLALAIPVLMVLTALVTIEARTTTSLKKFKYIEIAPWDPIQVIPNVRSDLMCCSICSNVPDCLVSEFIPATQDCELGHPTDFSPMIGGKTGYFNVEAISTTITVTIMDTLNYNDPLEQALVSLIQLNQNNHSISAITDLQGQAVLETRKYEQVNVEVFKEGYYTTSKIIETSNATEISVILITAPLLPPNTLRGSMTWSGEISDLDIYVAESGTGGCYVYYGSRECYVSNTTYVKHEIDVSSYGANGGEAITFSGIFPETFEAIVFIKNYIGAGLMYKANMEFLLLGGPEPVQVVGPPGDETMDESYVYWIIGCFKPAAGIDSFVPINIYSTNETHPCP